MGWRSGFRRKLFGNLQSYAYTVSGNKTSALHFYFGWFLPCLSRILLLSHCVYATLRECSTLYSSRRRCVRPTANLLAHIIKAVESSQGYCTGRCWSVVLRRSSLRCMARRCQSVRLLRSAHGARFVEPVGAGDSAHQFGRWSR